MKIKSSLAPKTFLPIIFLFSFCSLYAQYVGINTTTPQTTLHVYNGASGATPFAFSPLAVESNGHTYINLLSPAANETAILFGQPGSSANGALMYNNTSTLNGFQFRNNGNLTRMVLNNVGNVGIGTILPNARLSLSANGTELTGTTASNSFRTNAGNLNTTVTSELSLASIGLFAGNNVSLGIRAFRNVAGTDWTSAALLLEYDVDNTLRAAGGGSGYLALNANGNFGFGVINPLEKLEVSGNVKAANYIYSTPKTFHYTLSGSDFASEKSTDTVVVSVGSGGVNMQNNISGKRIIAPVHLPDGAIMVKMTVYFTDNSSSDNLRAILYRKTILNNIFPDNLGFVASTGSSGVTTAYQTPVNSFSSSNVVDNSLYTYYISGEVESSNGIWISNMDIRAIVIEYTLNAAQ